MNLKVATYYFYMLYATANNYDHSHFKNALNEDR
jgi:hypothetical protein